MELHSRLLFLQELMYKFHCPQRGKNSAYDNGRFWANGPVISSYYRKNVYLRICIKGHRAS